MYVYACIQNLFTSAYKCQARDLVYKFSYRSFFHPVVSLLLSFLYILLFSTSLLPNFFFIYLGSFLSIPL